jgi:hypothetical protein
MLSRTAVREDTNSHAAANIERASKFKVPHIEVSRPRPGQCIIVGGAPSVTQFSTDIRVLRYQARNYLIALNWAHTWLIAQGIIPHASVFFEIDVDPYAAIQRPDRDVTYFVCSHCHNRTWEHLRGFKTILWHALTDQSEITAAQCKFFPGEPLLSGGLTTLIRAIDIGRVLGYRNFELFGCDSSFEKTGPTHIPGYPLDGHIKGGLLERIKFCLSDTAKETFWTTLYLAKQATQFQQWCSANHSTFLMRVHGEGLLRYIHQRDWPEQYI